MFSESRGRYSQIIHLSVADLLAGTISTNKFLIASDDGGIRIQGATQQWSDTDGTVRMQAGRDANGDFTFSLFDKTGKGILIDATGVKPDAIADGLIVNKMVSDSANIAASKLDINSLFTEINNSSKVIKSNRIWLDDSNQSLNQAYTKMSQNITRIGDTASSASDSASAATDAAKKAMETLSGISTLDAIGASLNNDAHVVHTYADGTGGDYSSCYTVFSVFLGDTDVSDHIDEIKATTSPGIAGTWDPNLRKYQVTAMSTDSGYVDISALYGLESKVLLVGGKGLIISGKTMVVKSVGSWITKRFSVSKAKDGKIGLSYDLRASTQIIKKLKDDKTLEPANVTFSAFKNDNGMVSSYSGKFQIEESTDSGKTYNIKYGSTSPELMKVYTPSGPDVNIIKCSLYDESGVQLLDTQTVSIISDAAGLAKDIAAADKGANAKAHAKAQHDGNFKGYSAHVYVDDTEAYQALPYNRGAWHVGVNYGGRLFGTVNNRNSVGIEMCVQAGYNYEKAFQNTVQVCKQLMKQLGIPADRVVQHYDVCAKNCPSAIRAKGDWNRFKQLIGAKTATPTVDKYYRTRKSWADSKSQIGAYKSLENAKKEWKQGYTIYDWNGKAVYPVQTSKKAVVLTGKFETQLPIIRKGNSGVAVSVLQSVLGVTVDGNFGDDTETSLKVFQKNTGVKANGTCGIDSWKKVIEHVKANTK